MSSKPLALAAALVLSACAIQPRPSTVAAPRAAPAADAKPPAQPKVICVNEAPTGSRISSRRCRPVEEVERERQATQVDLLQPRAGPPPKGN